MCSLELSTGCKVRRGVAVQQVGEDELEDSGGRGEGSTGQDDTMREQSGRHKGAQIRILQRDAGHRSELAVCHRHHQVLVVVRFQEGKEFKTMLARHQQVTKTEGKNNPRVLVCKYECRKIDELKKQLIWSGCGKKFGTQEWKEVEQLEERVFSE